MRRAVLLALAATFGSPSMAQTSSSPMTIGGVQPLMLTAGTPIRLRTITELTTKGKHLKVGDRFSLEVADPVLLAGHVVIPVGSNALGEVTAIRNKGMWGKSGNIETRLLSLTANGRTMRISGGIGDKGVKAGGAAIATSAIVFLPAGFFMTGTSAVIPPGALVQGILAEDVPVMFAGDIPQPMAVSSVTPPAKTEPIVDNAAQPPTITPKSP